MLYMEIIAVCSEIHTEHINTHKKFNTIHFKIPNTCASECLRTKQILTSDLGNAQENRKDAKIPATIQ